jgi:hypothetical protein
MRCAIDLDSCSFDAQGATSVLLRRSPTEGVAYCSEVVLLRMSRFKYARTDSHSRVFKGATCTARGRKCGRQRGALSGQ